MLIRDASHAEEGGVGEPSTADRRWELTEYYRIARWSLLTLVPLAAALVVLTILYVVLNRVKRRMGASSPVLASLIALYQLSVGAGILLGNFRALMDLPLPVGEQLTVMRALAERHADFAHIGAVETRVSGDDRMVDVELQFAAETSLDHVEAVAGRLRADLAQRLDGLQLRVAPRTHVRSVEPPAHEAE